MNEALAAIVGGLLGVIFFGGLWVTVRKGVRSPRPALWFLGSLVLRTSIVLSGFYFVGSESWERLLACLCGFILARLIVMRLIRAASKYDTPLSKEAHHAP